MKHEEREKKLEMITNSKHDATKAEFNVHDRATALKALDDTKTGIKGLVDAGLTKIPQIFIHERHRPNKHSWLSPLSWRSQSLI